MSFAQGARNVIVGALDAALEVAPPLGYTTIGFGARRRLGAWEPIPPDALAGRVVVVTGAGRGLGFEAASQMMQLGATVEIVVRDQARGEASAAELAERTSLPAPNVRVADTGELGTLRVLADELRSTHEHIDVLVHNAGAIIDDRLETPDGIEATWASMVVGPHLLTRLLGDRLDDGRVIWVTSGGMYGQALDLDDPEFRLQTYRGVTAYARAKRAQVDLVAEYAARGLPATRTTSVAVHPGWADTPGVETSLPGFHRLVGPVLRSPGQGVDTLVWLAATRERVRTGSLYFDRRPRSVIRLPGTGTSLEGRKQLWALVEAQSGLAAA